MTFEEVVEVMMSGGCNAVRRNDWHSGFCLCYAELANVFILIGTHGRTKMEKLTLPIGDLLANDWHTVELSPITGKPMRRNNDRN